MSFSAIAFKVVSPLIATRLLKALGVDSKLAGTVIQKAIDATGSELLKPARGHIGLPQKIEAMTRDMASDIQLLFEGQNRQEVSKEAIAFAIAQTLMQAGLAQNRLAAMNFDVVELRQFLLIENLEAIQYFSEAERAVYKQAMGVISQRLIEAAPTLEGYEQAKTTEILQRLDTLVMHLGIERDIAIQAEDTFVKKYRDVVIDELDHLEIFGLPRMDQLTRQQSLSMAYISLSASGFLHPDTKTLTRLHVRDSCGDAIDRGGREVKQIFGPVEQTICNCQRIVIRGSAGAGKSTLLQWLAVRAASQSFEGSLIPWNTKIPFFIRLRSLLDSGFPAPEQFVSLIAKNIAAQMPSSWTHQYLNRGQALILIDGVDELPRQSREDFFISLQALVRDFPNSTFIVTSRPSGLKSAEGGKWDEWEFWVEDQKFQNLILEPMSSVNIELFVERWHQALAEVPHFQKTGNLEYDPHKTAKDLNRQLIQRPELMRLASTPLLCAMICSLHRERLDNLPSARLELYRDCIDILLNRRDQGRKITLDDVYPTGLNEFQKIELLQSLALKLMRLNLSSIEAHRVDAHFELELKTTSLPDYISGQQIRAFFVDRAALLREPIVGQINFVHRTLQEYLAAKAILDEDSLEELLQKASDDQWQESIIIFAGLAGFAARNKLLNGLLQKAIGMSPRDVQKDSIRVHEPSINTKRNRKYLQLLAIACLETVTRIEPSLRQEILDRAKALIPPNNFDEIAMITRAGNAIVSLLRYKPHYSEQESAYCIQALVSIGTHEALDFLEEYARLPAKWSSFEVSYSFGQGWNHFHHETYAKRILSYLQSIVFTSTQIKDISALSSLAQLRVLSLDSTDVCDVSPLSTLTQLKQLSLYNTKVTNITPLSALAQLEVLSLDSTRINDLLPLSKCTHLKHLRICSTQVTDISPLSQLSELEVLHLSDTSITDLSGLRKLNKLKVLSLSYTRISNILPLSKLTQLQRLHLDTTLVRDISPLSKLVQLEVLNLNSTLIIDLSPLSTLTHLKKLYLNHTRVRDISVLNHLIQLRIYS